MENGEWKNLSKGTCIGHKRIEVLNGNSYSGVKLEITKSEGKPDIQEMECY